MSAVRIAKVSAEEVYPLRQLILRPEKPYEFSIYPADKWESTLHLGAFLSTNMVGIASIYLESPADRSLTASWRLRDMGVLKEMSGKGCGTALLNACVNHISAQHGKIFWCYARKTAVQFYLSRGFQLNDRPFELEGFGERFYMWRTIS